VLGDRLVMQESLFYQFWLDDHVPADHMLRTIDRFVDLDGFRRHLAPFHSTAVGGGYELALATDQIILADDGAAAVALPESAAARGAARHRGWGVTRVVDKQGVPRLRRQFLHHREKHSNLRFVGPETMESKTFSRLTAWQNRIFQRPNAEVAHHDTGQRR